jgi:hypothetical protein
MAVKLHNLQNNWCKRPVISKWLGEGRCCVCGTVLAADSTADRFVSSMAGRMLRAPCDL